MGTSLDYGGPGTLTRVLARERWAGQRRKRVRERARGAEPRPGFAHAGEAGTPGPTVSRRNPRCHPPAWSPGRPGGVSHPQNRQQEPRVVRSHRCFGNLSQQPRGTRTVLWIENVSLYSHRSRPRRGASRQWPRWGAPRNPGKASRLLLDSFQGPGEDGTGGSTCGRTEGPRRGPLRQTARCWPGVTACPASQWLPAGCLLCSVQKSLGCRLTRQGLRGLGTAA